MARLTVETSEFEFAHGKLPRGEGCWIFRFATTTGPVQEFAKVDGNSNLSWAVAKKWAQVRGAALKAYSVAVCS